MKYELCIEKDLKNAPTPKQNLAFFIIFQNPRDNYFLAVQIKMWEFVAFMNALKAYHTQKVNHSAWTNLNFVSLFQKYHICLFR